MAASAFGRLANDRAMAGSAAQPPADVTSRPRPCPPAGRRRTRFRRGNRERPGGRRRLPGLVLRRPGLALGRRAACSPSRPGPRPRGPPPSAGWPTACHAATPAPRPGRRRPPAPPPAPPRRRFRCSAARDLGPRPVQLRPPGPLLGRRPQAGHRRRHLARRRPAGRPAPRPGTACTGRPAPAPPRTRPAGRRRRPASPGPPAAGSTRPSAPTYGGWPVRIAHRIAPRPNTSLRSSTWSTAPIACSGGMYAGVPSTLPAWVAVVRVPRRCGSRCRPSVVGRPPAGSRGPARRAPWPGPSP